MQLAIWRKDVACARDVASKGPATVSKPSCSFHKRFELRDYSLVVNVVEGKENLRAPALGGASSDSQQESLHNDEYSQPVRAVFASTGQILALIMLVHSRKRSAISLVNFC